MSHGGEIPSTAPRGELPELRGGGTAEPDAVPSVRATKRRARQAELALEARPDASSTDAGPRAPAASEGGLSVGDRVTLTGEVVIMSTVGSPWMFVRLDGDEPHTVACRTGNATLHKGDARRSDNEGKGNG